MRKVSRRFRSDLRAIQLYVPRIANRGEIEERRRY